MTPPPHDDDPPYLTPEDVQWIRQQRADRCIVCGGGGPVTRHRPAMTDRLTSRKFILALLAQLANVLLCWLIYRAESASNIAARFIMHNNTKGAPCLDSV